MDKYCVNCGKVISQEAEFCKYCGAAQYENNDAARVGAINNSSRTGASIEKKHKSSKTVKVAGLAVALVALGLIAAFVIGANWLKSKNENGVSDQQELTSEHSEEESRIEGGEDWVLVKAIKSSGNDTHTTEITYEFDKKWNCSRAEIRSDDTYGYRVKEYLYDSKGEQLLSEKTTYYESEHDVDEVKKAAVVTYEYGSDDRVSGGMLENSLEDGSIETRRFETKYDEDAKTTIETWYEENGLLIDVYDSKGNIIHEDYKENDEVVNSVDFAKTDGIIYSFYASFFIEKSEEFTTSSFSL